MNLNRILLLALALTVLGASTASAGVPKLTNRMVTVKITGSQKTTWQASPVADPGCQNKPTGTQGSGNETVEWSTSRAIKGQLTGSGPNWGLMLFDQKNKPTFKMPIAGSINRTGGGIDVVCGKSLEDRSQPCVGRKAFDTNAQVAFGVNKQFTVDDDELTMVGALYPACNWIYNSMTVRTGDVLVNVGVGKFDPKRLSNGKSSVTLSTHKEERCQDQSDNDPGVQCTTVTDWRVSLYPYKKKGRR